MCYKEKELSILQIFIIRIWAKVPDNPMKKYQKENINYSTMIIYTQTNNISTKQWSYIRSE